MYGPASQVSTFDMYKTFVERNLGLNSIVTFLLVLNSFENKWYYINVGCVLTSQNPIQYPSITMSSRKISCSECSSTFSSEWAYNRHYNEKHSGYQFIRNCPIKGCSKQFNRKYCLVQHLRRQHGLSTINAKETVKNVEVRCVSKEDLDRNKFQVVKIDDYSDISEDEFDFDEISNQSFSKNLPSDDICNVTTEEQELTADLDSITSAENFSITTCETPPELSDDELTGLQHDLGLIAEELEPEPPLDPNCIVVSDSEDDISPDETVVDTTTTTVILTLIRKDITFSDGSMETTRSSTVSYSTGVDPERIDFESLANTVIDEIPNHFKKQNCRYTNSNIF
ncbi:unnamed protein product [Mytilus edulis]|uniref:C2H2-type domain-containing protein n=2 Tax=Mytilus TaxID=6548 RepID=A0A8S3R945_MYTED|nr:unnamed protein product [Mytilus edulis]